MSRLWWVAGTCLFVGLALSQWSRWGALVTFLFVTFALTQAFGMQRRCLREQREEMDALLARTYEAVERHRGFYRD